VNGIEEGISFGPEKVLIFKRLMIYPSPRVIEMQNRLLALAAFLVMLLLLSACQATKKTRITIDRDITDEFAEQVQIIDAGPAIGISAYPAPEEGGWVKVWHGGSQSEAPYPDNEIAYVDVESIQYERGLYSVNVRIKRLFWLECADCDPIYEQVTSESEEAWTVNCENRSINRGDEMGWLFIKDSWQFYSNYHVISFVCSR